jgi:ribosomal protein S12 methylthiotransferase
VPEVDAVIGTGEVARIMEAVEGDLRMLPAQPPAFLYHHLTPRIVTTPKHATYIKIAEGCDHPCTFCIIPQLRGAFRSRRFESVVREAENLAKAGAREITLIGQDTTSYGEDLGLRDGLAQLLEKLAQTGDLLWVRFLYAYPNRVTQKLLDTIAAHPRLAKYMDMPLQHASRNVLARMKRGSNGDAFLKLLERIRTTIPGVSLRTSFIVGFPGETEADFEELCDFVRTAKLDWMGVFEYSDVDNAGSYALDEKVDAETISDRRNRLMAIQKKISRENLRAQYLRAKPRAATDCTFTALVEGPSKDNPLVWEARLEGMAPEIDGKLYLTDIELPRRTPTTWSGASSKFCRGLPQGPARGLLRCRRFRPLKSFIASPPGHPSASWPELYSSFEDKSFLASVISAIPVLKDFTQRSQRTQSSQRRKESRYETQMPYLQSGDRLRGPRGLPFLQRALPGTGPG